MICPRTIQLRDSEAEKELPDTASGPQLRSSEVRERATPRPRGTPNSDGSRTSRKKTAKVTITATGQLCCTQRLVGDLGVPVPTSLFLVLSRRDSCERAIIGLGLSVLVSESRGLLDLASPSGSSGTVFLPPLVPSILSEHNRSRLLAMERPTRRVQSFPIVVVGSSIISSSRFDYQSRWEPTLSLCGSCLLFGFLNLQIWRCDDRFLSIRDAPSNGIDSYDQPLCPGRRLLDLRYFIDGHLLGTLSVIKSTIP